MALLSPLSLKAARSPSEVIPAAKGNLCKERHVDSESWQSPCAHLFPTFSLMVEVTMSPTLGSVCKPDGLLL